jgi:hypothetical protein
MTIQDRLTQFQEELSQRKHLMDNRIHILTTTSAETNGNRIEQLQAAKKELKDIQDLFYDFFYNELTSVPSREEAPQRPASISLDSLLGDHAHEVNPSASQIKPAEQPVTVEQQGGETTEAAADQGKGKRIKPDMSKILGDINKIRKKHQND